MTKGRNSQPVHIATDEDPVSVTSDIGGFVLIPVWLIRARISTAWGRVNPISGDAIKLWSILCGKYGADNGGVNVYAWRLMADMGFTDPDELAMPINELMSVGALTVQPSHDDGQSATYYAHTFRQSGWQA